MDTANTYSRTMAVLEFKHLCLNINNYYGGKMGSILNHLQIGLNSLASRSLRILVLV